MEFRSGLQRDEGLRLLYKMGTPGDKGLRRGLLFKSADRSRIHRTDVVQQVKPSVLDFVRRIKRAAHSRAALCVSTQNLIRFALEHCAECPPGGLIKVEVNARLYKLTPIRV